MIFLVRLFFLCLFYFSNFKPSNYYLLHSYSSDNFKVIATIGFIDKQTRRTDVNVIRTDSLDSNIVKGTINNIDYIHKGFAARFLYLSYPKKFYNQNIERISNQAGIGVVDGDGIKSQYTINYYIATDKNQLGWNIGTPLQTEYSTINFFNNNIYIGQLIGPETANEDGGMGNIGLGRRIMYKMPHKLLYSFNTGIGYYNMIISNSNEMKFNVTLGNFNLISSKNFLIKEKILSDDLKSQNQRASNFNICIGNATLNTSDATQQINNRQNICIGNLSMQGVVKGQGNICIGNGIFVPKNVITNTFINPKNNIIIGNNILTFDVTEKLYNIANNIILYPNGTEDDIFFANNTSNSVFIGTFGSKDKTTKSNRTYINNIYDMIFKMDGDDMHYNIGSENTPRAVWTTNYNMLGTVINGTPSFGDNSKVKEITKDTLDRDIVDELLRVPIMAITSKDKGGTNEEGSNEHIFEGPPMFMVNSDELHKRTKKETPEEERIKYLANFLIYKKDDKDKKKKPIGYEHMHLIPLLIRKIQLLSKNIDPKTDIEISGEISAVKDGTSYRFTVGKDTTGDETKANVNIDGSLTTSGNAIVNGACFLGNSKVEIYPESGIEVSLSGSESDTIQITTLPTKESTGYSTCNMLAIGADGKVFKTENFVSEFGIPDNISVDANDNISINTEVDGSVNIGSADYLGNIKLHAKSSDIKFKTSTSGNIEIEPADLLKISRLPEVEKTGDEPNFSQCKILLMEDYGEAGPVPTGGVQGAIRMSAVDAYELFSSGDGGYDRIAEEPVEGEDPGCLKINTDMSGPTYIGSSTYANKLEITGPVTINTEGKGSVTINTGTGLPADDSHKIILSCRGMDVNSAHGDIKFFNDSLSNLITFKHATGNMETKGGLAVADGKFNIDKTYGNVHLKGNLTVGGPSSGESKFSIDKETGNTHISGDLTVDGSTGITIDTIDVDKGISAASKNFQVSKYGDVTIGNSHLGTVFKVSVANNSGITEVTKLHVTNNFETEEIYVNKIHNKDLRLIIGSVNYDSNVPHLWTGRLGVADHYKVCIDAGWYGDFYIYNLNALDKESIDKKYVLLMDYNGKIYRTQNYVSSGIVRSENNDMLLKTTGSEELILTSEDEIRVIGDVLINTDSSLSKSTIIGHGTFDSGPISLLSHNANIEIKTTESNGTANISINAIDGGNIEIASSAGSLELNNSGSGTTAIGVGSTGRITIGDESSGNIVISSGGTIKVGNESSGSTEIIGSLVLSGISNQDLSNTEESIYRALIYNFSTGEVTCSDEAIVTNTPTTATEISTRNLKRDIRKAILSKESFRKLMPVIFKYKESVTKDCNRDQWGLIAEEVAETALKTAVIYDDNGNPKALDYKTIFVALLQQYLETCKEFDEMKEDLNTLKKEFLSLNQHLSNNNNKLLNF
jgi:hypothetical protein